MHFEKKCFPEKFVKVARANLFKQSVLFRMEFKAVIILPYAFFFKNV